MLKNLTNYKIFLYYNCQTDNTLDFVSVYNESAHTPYRKHMCAVIR